MTKNLLWTSACAAALLVATGCRQQEPQQQQQGQPVAEAQRQSEQSLEQAQEAQEQALEQREEVAEAREGVREQRQELTQEQRELQQARQEALEAQRRAEQQAQQAQQQAQQAREELAQRQEQMPQPGAAQPGMGQQADAMLMVNGEVVAAREDSLLLRSPEGKSVRLLLNEDTQVFINGQEGEISNIARGAEVRASYQPSGEQEPTALRVDVVNQATGGSEAQPRK